MSPHEWETLLSEAKESSSGGMDVQDDLRTNISALCHGHCFSLLLIMGHSLKAEITVTFAGKQDSRAGDRHWNNLEISENAALRNVFILCRDGLWGWWGPQFLIPRPVGSAPGPTVGYAASLSPPSGNCFISLLQTHPPPVSVHRI